MFGIARLDGAPSPWSIVRFSEKLAKGHAARTSASDSAPSLVTVIDKTTSVPTASVGATHACDTVISAPADTLTPKNKISSAPDPTIAGGVVIRRFVRRYSERVELMESYFENMRRASRRFQSIKFYRILRPTITIPQLMTSSPFPPSISFSSALLRPTPFHLAARAGQIPFRTSTKRSEQLQAGPHYGGLCILRFGHHGFIRPRERSVRRSFSHNRPFGKCRGACNRLCSLEHNDALCPLDRTS